MMKWGRKKTWFSRFKKTTIGGETESRNARFDKWMYEDDDDDDILLYNSNYRINVSPVSCKSFKKMASNERTMRELISEEAPEIIIQETSQDCVKSKLKTTVDDSIPRRIKLDSSLEEEWKRLKNLKMNEIMLKNEKQRKCVDVSKEMTKKRSNHGRKVNVNSPRIKPIEDMKKTRLKMNKERAIKDAFRTCLDSFAIIKSSFDPQRDFRDSMIEMIIEKRIRKREDLEELLACYLTLNCDEYHHLIVKVFQQVWFELNQAYYDPYFRF